LSNYNIFYSELKKVLYNKNLLAVFINGFLPLLYVIVFNFYGAEKYGLDFLGDYSYKIAFATIVNSLLTFGVTTYSSKYVVELIYLKKSPFLFLFNVYLIELIKLVPVVIILYFFIDLFKLEYFSTAIILVTNILIILPVSFFFQIREARELFARSFFDYFLLSTLKLCAFLFYGLIYKQGQFASFYIITTFVPHIIFIWYLCVRYKIHRYLFDLLSVDRISSNLFLYKNTVQNLYKFSFKLSPLILFESISSNLGVFYLKKFTGNSEIGIYRLFQTVLGVILTLNALWSKYIGPSIIIQSLSTANKNAIEKLLNKAILGNLVATFSISLLIYSFYSFESSFLYGLKFFGTYSICAMLGILIVVSSGIIGTLYTSINKPQFIPIFVGVGSFSFAAQLLLLPVSINNVLLYHFVSYLLTQILSFYYAIFYLNYNLKSVFYFLLFFGFLVLVSLFMLKV
jgi:hypothetical protein